MNARRNRMFRKLGIFVLIFMFILSGCNSIEESKFTGTVYKIDDKNNRILVVKGISEQDLEMDTIDLLKSKKYKDVIWFSGINAKNFKIKDEIEVWYNAMDTSYPGQSTANKIKKIK
jgi:hypothetical protein